MYAEELSPKSSAARVQVNTPAFWLTHRFPESRSTSHTSSFMMSTSLRIELTLLGNSTRSHEAPLSVEKASSRSPQAHIVERRSLKFHTHKGARDRGRPSDPKILRNINAVQRSHPNHLFTIHVSLPDVSVYADVREHPGSPTVAGQK